LCSAIPLKYKSEVLEELDFQGKAERSTGKMIRELQMVEESTQVLNLRTISKHVEFITVSQSQLPQSKMVEVRGKLLLS